MDAQTVWLVLLSIATQLAGVVGFTIQLRQVKQTRLENEKLHLEIAALKAARAERESLVRLATMDEVMRIRDPDGPRFSRRSTPSASLPSKSAGKFLKTLSIGGLVFLALLFLGYLGYDIFRLGRWLMGFPNLLLPSVH
jgi:hypothetical protein